MKKPSASVCAFGSALLLRYLQAMLVEAPGVRRAADIEHIHRMRVASRRLRAALPLFANCYAQKKTQEWLKALRRVTRSLGAARDLDVQMDTLEKFLKASKKSQNIPGVRRLQLRWSQQRQALQKDVLKALDDMQETRIFEKMGATLLPFTLGVEPDQPPTPQLFALANHSIRNSLDKFLSYAPFIHQPEKKDELHQMRIAAKGLRYVVETFAPLYPQGLSEQISVLRAAQDLLGEIHDSDVWVDGLPQFLEEEKTRAISFYGTQGPWNLLLPGVNAFLEDRRGFRAERYQTFQRKWQQWQEKQTWDTLRELSHAPLAVTEPPTETLVGIVPEVEA